MNMEKKRHSQRFVIFSNKSLCYLARVTEKEITVRLKNPVQFVSSIKKAKTFADQRAIRSFETANNWKPTSDLKAYLVTEGGLMLAEEVEL